MTRTHHGRQREPLRTSREVYDRVRWDPQLDPERFTVVYEDRERGEVEVPLPGFDPEGEIPWHRVQAFKRDGVTVWDRRERIDLLSAPRAHPEAPGLDVTALAPVHTSALVVIPPLGAWEPIQAIRERHDRHAARWMPHVTLVYGFVPEHRFGDALPVIERAVAGVEPFTVTLEGFDRFAHGGGFTVWIRPTSAPPGALEGLQARLAAAFPRCNEQSTKSPRGFTPHLSVAQFPRADARVMEERVAAWTAAWSPISFVVYDVPLIARAGDEPFRVAHRVALGARRG